MKHLLLLLSMVLFSSQLFADEYLIPVVTKTYKPNIKLPENWDKNTGWIKDNGIYVGKDSKGKPILIDPSKFKTNVKFNTIKTSSTKLAKTIKEVKTTVCSAVDDAEVKVFFSFDADAKIFGIGASSEAGFELTFKCKTT